MLPSMDQLEEGGLLGTGTPLKRRVKMAHFKQISPEAPKRAGKGQ